MAPTLRLLLALATTMLCAALLAGCGGTSKADYQKQMKHVDRSVRKDLDSLNEGQPDPQELRQAAKTIDRAADDVDDIDPPSEVKDLHERLVANLHDTADIVKQLAPLMQQSLKDPLSLDRTQQDKLTKLSGDFGKVQAEFEKIQKGYKAKGYDVGFTLGS